MLWTICLPITSLHSEARYYGEKQTQHVVCIRLCHYVSQIQNPCWAALGEPLHFMRVSFVFISVNVLHPLCVCLQWMWASFGYQLHATSINSVCTIENCNLKLVKVNTKWRVRPSLWTHVCISLSSVSRRVPQILDDVYSAPLMVLVCSTTLLGNLLPCHPQMGTHVHKAFKERMQNICLCHHECQPMIALMINAISAHGQTDKIKEKSFQFEQELDCHCTLAQDPLKGWSVCPSQSILAKLHTCLGKY